MTALVLPVTSTLLHVLADAAIVAPLPSSMLMGLALLGGVVVFTRVPSSGRKRGRVRRY